jgi:hypothetical protein
MQNSKREVRQRDWKAKGEEGKWKKGGEVTMG